MSADLLSPTTPWRSELLASLPGVTHAITRRVSGMGRADGNIGYGRPRDREDGWAMRQQWCAAAGLAADRLVTLAQVHGAEVRLAAAVDAGRGAQPGSPPIGLGDALATAESGPVLMTLHADCQPVLFVDPGSSRRGPAVAIAHAGWRGTVADVVGRTVAVMAARFGTRPQDLRVYLGPAIGVCCYHVGDEVAAAWQDRAGAEASGAIAQDGERRRFSLTAANALLLERAGVPPTHIDAAPVCTHCDGEHWFSHRRQGSDAGRFGAMIAVRDGR